ncbi:MAG: diguanylate cyclase [Burkholderiaceae bacterium]|nr:diguanylate cyclase [Burkholderiaceae bacterium]
MKKIFKLPHRALLLYDRKLPVLAAATLSVVLGCLSLVALDAWQLWRERSADMHESEIFASNLARSLAQHVEDMVLTSDITLREMVENMEADGASPRARARLHAMLADRIKATEWLRSLSVYDEKGRWIVNSELADPPYRDNSDREYFIYHSSHAERGPLIGLPVRSKTRGDWIVTVSRRIDHADGSFAGVALATISLDYIKQFYSTFDIGPHGAILLARDTGAILTRFPFDESLIGKDLSKGRLFQDYLKKSQFGTARITSMLDGVERLNGYRHLDHYPLVIDVALSTDDILDHWYTEVWVHVAGVGILVVALGAIGYRMIVQIYLRMQTQKKLRESERRLRMIADNMPAFIAYVDRDQKYRFCNAYYVDEFDRPMEQLLGRSMRELFGEEAYATVAPYVERALAGETVNFERHAPERGADSYSLYHYAPDVDQDGQVWGFYALVLDITPRKLAELRLASREKLLRALTDNLPALVSYIDGEERFQFNNQPYEAWLGKPLSEITGHWVKDAVGEESYFKYKRFYDKAMTGRKVDFAFAADRDGGKRYYNAAYIPQFDENGRVVGVCSMINDITELKKVELKLIKLARVDALTGLPNRVRFDENLHAAMARSRRTGAQMALMYLDIDRFKSINDTYGHQAGDEALCEFAKRLTASVRKTDSVARLSGDEFVIILEDMKTRDEAEIVANKILKSMEPEFRLMGHAYGITTSIGIAILRQDDVDQQTILRRADQALYQAKSDGRSIYRFAAD